jgi:hypothetical protein
VSTFLGPVFIYAPHSASPLLYVAEHSTAHQLIHIRQNHDPIKHCTPPPLHSTCPCIVGGGAREPLLSVLQIYSEGQILSFSCEFAGWTRWYYWCIAVYFRFLASKALHRTLYHPEHFSVPQFQPWMLIMLTRTQLVLLSTSNLLGAVLCLPRLCLPQGLGPTA